jgi:hypothetical protein
VAIEKLNAFCGISMRKLLNKARLINALSILLGMFAGIAAFSHSTRFVFVAIFCAVSVLCLLIWLERFATKVLWLYALMVDQTFREAWPIMRRGRVRDYL